MLEGTWYGPRSERLRDEFKEGAGPRPWAIEDGGGGVRAQVRGDGHAQALCKYTAKKAGLAGMWREEAARSNAACGAPAR